MTRPRDEIRHVGRQLLAHFIDPGQLELRLWARSGWRQKIQPTDRIEIWHGLTLVGELTGDAVHSLITHHLAGAALGAHLLSQMATRRRPRTIDPDAGGAISLPALPPVVAPPTKRQQETARYRAKAPVRARCGVYVEETDRACTNALPCRYHSSTTNGPRER